MARSACGTFRGWIMCLLIVYIALRILNVIVIYYDGITEAKVDLDSTRPGYTAKEIAMYTYLTMYVIFTIELAFAFSPILAECKKSPCPYKTWNSFLKISLIFCIGEIVSEILLYASEPVILITVSVPVVAIALIFLIPHRVNELATERCMRVNSVTA